MIKDIINDFFKFLKKPNDVQIQCSFNYKIKFLLVLLFFELVFTFIIVIPVFSIIDSILSLKDKQINYSMTLLNSIFAFVILVPFLEELIFRKILRFQGIQKKIISREKWDKIFPFLVYLFAIIFGFIHLSNYLNSNAIFFILSPFIILSQLAGGFVITFIRVRLNFKWAVFYHFIWNLIFIILIPMTYSYLTKPYSDNTPNYSIVIEEKAFFKPEQKQSFKIDSLNGKIHALNIRQYSIQHVLDSIYGNKKYYVYDVLVNLDFKSKKGLGKEAFIELLQKEYDIE